MLIVLAAGLCGITKAQGQVEEVIIEQRLPGYKTLLAQLVHISKFRSQRIYC